MLWGAYFHNLANFKSNYTKCYHRNGPMCHTNDHPITFTTSFWIYRCSKTYLIWFCPLRVVDLLQVACSDYGGRTCDPRAWNEMPAGSAFSIITSCATHANNPRASYAIIWTSITSLHMHIKTAFCNHQLNFSCPRDLQQVSKSCNMPYSLYMQVHLQCIYVGTKTFFL